VAHEDRVLGGCGTCGSGSEKVLHMRNMVFESLALVDQGLGVCGTMSIMVCEGVALVDQGL
jgi:hypothetical protein